MCDSSDNSDNCDMRDMCDSSDSSDTSDSNDSCDISDQKTFFHQKNPAYGRQSISWPMRIVEQIPKKSC